MEGKLPIELGGLVLSPSLCQGRGEGSTQEVMNHICWSSNASYQRYSWLSQMVGRGSVSTIMANSGLSATSQCKSIFESCGDVTGLLDAFP